MSLSPGTKLGTFEITAYGQNIQPTCKLPDSLLMRLKTERDLDRCSSLVGRARWSLREVSLPGAALPQDYDDC